MNLRTMPCPGPACGHNCQGASHVAGFGPGSAIQSTTEIRKGIRSYDVGAIGKGHLEVGLNEIRPKLNLHYPR